MVYCIVGRQDSAHTRQVLERRFARDKHVTVIVERRELERRGAERRGPQHRAEIGERRRIISRDGRRILERRAKLVPVSPWALPRRVSGYTYEVRFVQRVEHDAATLEDADTNRLVAAFQTGDRQAFTRIYERYHARMLRAVHAGLRDYHAAEDVTQDVFICAMAKLPSYEIRPDQPLRSWLLGMARFEALNYTRKQRRITVGLESYALETVDEPSEFDQRIFGVLTDPTLSELIEEMPARQREVIAMRYVCDYKLVEIAGLLGRSPESIRQLHVRALSHLEQRLCELGRGPEGPRRRQLAMRNLVPQAIALRTRRFMLTRTLGVPPMLSWRRC